MTRLFFTFLMALIFAGPSAANPQSVKIGISLGLSGQYEGPAWMQKMALELWRDETNERGGILGRQVELIIGDDMGDPARARDIYRDLTQPGRVDAILAPYSSQLTAAVAPIVEKAGIPMLAAGAAADSLWRQGYRNVIGVLTPASRYTQGMLRLAKDAKLATVAIIHTQDEFSREIAAGTRKWAPFLRLDIVVDTEIDKASISISHAVGKAQAAHADLLIVAGYFDEALGARRALTVLNWMPPAFFATIGPSLPSWKETLGSSANLVFSTSVWEPNASTNYSRSREFAEAFRARFGVEPSYQAAAAYAAGQILAAAIEGARSTAHADIRDALFELDTYSVLGRFAVDRKGMQVKRLDMVIQWQDGRKQIVWPDELRTANPIFGRVNP